MMDHSLRSISYIADIGDLLVIMARRRLVPTEAGEDAMAQVIGATPKMICHVFESEEVTYQLSIKTVYFVSSYIEQSRTCVV